MQTGPTFASFLGKPRKCLHNTRHQRSEFIMCMAWKGQLTAPWDIMWTGQLPRCLVPRRTDSVRAGMAPSIPPELSDQPPTTELLTA